MSILDDAIREHLELKRAHGADEAELKRLEDEAFGPPQRPDELDPQAEAPTEFLTAPAEVVEQAASEQGRRVPNIADLQEAPPQPEPPAAEESEPEESAPEPAVEEQPAAELELPEPPPAEPQPEPTHTAEQREAIADQPTEMFDVQAELDADAQPESPAAPSVPEPDEDDDFFSEQRLSDELNQALEAPVTEEEPLPPLPAVEPAEGDEPAHDDDDEDYEEESGEHGVFEPETGSHEDVLEDTPDFLEDAPEDDDLWFEQRPPKDFDFDD